ncbi:MAG: NAD(P)/FAD-dependent oxidoreductase [Euryarchaeota archaeon]
MNKNNKKIIIIGGGIAGLSTGCYAQMNGFDAIIFEMHNKPGGLCTSWNRKGFTFDYCIHNLAGTGNLKLAKMWQELDAFSNEDIIQHDVFVRVEDEKGQKLNIYTDILKLKKHLKTISPEDEDVIDDYLNAGQSLVRADFFSMGMNGISSKLRIIPHAYQIIKWSNINLEEYAQRFKNDFLKKAFPNVQYNMDGSGIPVFPHLLFMAGFEAGDLGWPKYGSLQFSKRIENRFKKLGGELRYNSLVSKIILNDNRAVGVILKDGTEHYADIVISAGDGYNTIYNLLEGKFTSDFIDSYYQSYDESQEFGLQVFMGLNRDLKGEPHAIALLINQDLEIEGMKRDSLYVEIFDSTTGLSSEGKSVIKVVMRGNYNYWKKLKTDKDSYQQEKDMVYHKVINVLENRFPGIKEDVEIYDVTTPLTVERYTHNFHGWQVWSPPHGMMKVMFQGLSKTLPGLQNFYMVGQWAEAMIGIPTAALSGRNLIKTLCKKDGKKFRTQEK